MPRDFTPNEKPTFEERLVALEQRTSVLPAFTHSLQVNIQQLAILAQYTATLSDNVTTLSNDLANLKKADAVVFDAISTDMNNVATFCNQMRAGMLAALGALDATNTDILSRVQKLETLVPDTSGDMDDMDDTDVDEDTCLFDIETGDFQYVPVEEAIAFLNATFGAGAEEEAPDEEEEQDCDMSDLGGFTITLMDSDFDTSVLEQMLGLEVADESSYFKPTIGDEEEPNFSVDLAAPDGTITTFKKEPGFTTLVVAPDANLTGIRLPSIFSDDDFDGLYDIVSGCLTLAEELFESGRLEQEVYTTVAAVTEAVEAGYTVPVLGLLEETQKCPEYNIAPYLVDWSQTLRTPDHIIATAANTPLEEQMAAYRKTLFGMLFIAVNSIQMIKAQREAS